MKTMLRGLIAIGWFGMVISAALAADKIVITSQKKTAAIVKGEVGNLGTEKDHGTVHYELKLENQTLAELSDLVIKYEIFVERPKLGSKFDQPAPLTRVRGVEKVATLSTRMPQMVQTKEFDLHKQSLVGGSSYINGGRVKVEDAVVGVWVRIYQGEQQVAEYTNPPTVTKRGWDAEGQEKPAAVAQ